MTEKARVTLPGAAVHAVVDEGDAGSVIIVRGIQRDSDARFEPAVRAGTPARIMADVGAVVSAGDVPGPMRATNTSSSPAFVD